MGQVPRSIERISSKNWICQISGEQWSHEQQSPWIHEREIVSYEPARDFWGLDKNSRRRIWSRCRFPGF